MQSEYASLNHLNVAQIMSRNDVTDLYAYASAIVIGLVVCYFVFRHIKRRQERPISLASLRSPRETNLALIASAVGLLPLVYILHSSTLGDSPVVTLWTVSWGTMVLLRKFGAPWKLRLAAAPVSAAFAMISAAATATLPSLRFSSLSTDSWELLGVGAVGMALSFVIQIFASPIGAGEREH